MTNPALKVPQTEASQQHVFGILPKVVAQQVIAGRTVTYNQGRRLLVARKVKHLVVLQAA